MEPAFSSHFIFFLSVYEPIVPVLLGSIPHAHSLSERGVLLHCAPSHPRPLLSEQPFEGPGWPGAQWRMGVGGSTVGVTTLLATWPTASISTPVVHRAWWHPHTLWGDSVTSAPHQSPMIIWGLKVWLYHHTAISQVVMTLSINYNLSCPPLANTNFAARTLYWGPPQPCKP